MKKYEKPSIEVLAVDAMDQILADSNQIDVNLNGNSDYDTTIGQLSLRRRVYIEDDYEDDETAFGW